MACLKNTLLYLSLSILISMILSASAAAKMGGFGGDMSGEKKEKTAEEKLEERKKRRPAKMQDVMWDKETQGMLRLFCKPAANLFIDGEIQKDPKGKSKLSEKFALSLSAGEHVITLERDGFVTEERKMTIEAGKPYAENFILMKKGHQRGEMVLISAGEFWMGIDDWDLKIIDEKIGGEKRFHRNESPRHKVMVDAFQIDKYEVTNAQYKEFADATKLEVLPDNWENKTYPEGKADFPVTYVTWHNADNFCKWSGKRLPTESEWEKAARWGPDKNITNKKDDSTLYPWGNRFNRNDANTKNGGPGHTTITGQYEKGRSAYGIYDMSGNVKEWTADWYQDYPGSEFKDEFSAQGEVKVARGGSFFEKHYDCLATCRFKYSPNSAYDDLGFRCAKDAK
jgi:formylglycine-generating enzyme required for sulfatase activity